MARDSKEFAPSDAERVFGLAEVRAEEPSECISAEILLGHKKPTDCPAFGTLFAGKALGPMVSTEGGCAA
jgi:hydrogenase expression/formation protein HypD